MKFGEFHDMLCTEFGIDLADDICKMMCAKCPGDEMYIPRRFGEPDIKPNDTPATVAKRHGVSRQTGYNWVNRFRR